MEFKDILSKLSFPPKQVKKKEEEAILMEENQIKEAISKLVDKNPNFLPLGFVQKEEEENEEMEYGDCSDEYIEEQL